jgi:diacylglycerol kinase family enzyme
MSGVVFLNPRSGPDETGANELRQRFPGHRVEECKPGDLPQRVKEAVDEHVSFVAVAGGDGTIRCAAEQMTGSDVPLLPVPAGTRNHFAQDVGLSSLDDAADAAAAGHVEPVDVGVVNGRVFVNNSSIGLYPKIVIRREAHERRLRKGVANLVAVWEQLLHGRKIGVTIDGASFPAWMVFVGNGVYGEGLLDLADREELCGHVLDVRAVRADRPLARLRVLGALALGRLSRSPLVMQQRCRSVSVDVHQSRVEVALDGEVEVLESPLEFESRPGALSVLVPPTP